MISIEFYELLKKKLSEEEIRKYDATDSMTKEDFTKVADSGEYFIQSSEPETTLIATIKNVDGKLIEQRYIWNNNQIFPENETEPIQSISEHVAKIFKQQKEALLPELDRQNYYANTQLARDQVTKGEVQIAIIDSEIGANYLSAILKNAQGQIVNLHFKLDNNEILFAYNNNFTPIDSITNFVNEKLLLNNILEVLNQDELKKVIRQEEDINKLSAVAGDFLIKINPPISDTIILDVLIRGKYGEINTYSYQFEQGKVSLKNAGIAEGSLAQHAKKQDSQEKFYYDQHWYIEQMKELGYQQIKSPGFCDAVQTTGRAAMLIEEDAPGSLEKSFNERIHVLKAIPGNELKAKIDTVMRDLAGKIPGIRAALLKNWKIENEDEFKKLTESQKKQFNNELQTKIDLERDKLSDLEKILYDIPPFLDSVKAFQELDNYEDDQGNIVIDVPVPTAEKRKLLASLITPKALEDLGGEVKVTGFSGVYSATELTDYFRTLRESLTKDPGFSHPISIKFGTVAEHAISVGYNPKKQRWTLVDANHLPAMFIKQNDEKFLAEQVFIALNIPKSSRQQNVIASEIFIAANPNKVKGNKEQEAIIENQTNIMNHLSEWRAQPSFIAMHKVTLEKISELDDGGSSWLHSACAMNEATLVGELLNKGADLTLRNKHNLLPEDLARFEKNTETLEVITEFINQKELIQEKQKIEADVFYEKISNFITKHNRSPVMKDLRTFIESANREPFRNRLDLMKEYSLEFYSKLKKSSSKLGTLFKVSPDNKLAKELGGLLKEVGVDAEQSYKASKKSKIVQPVNSHSQRFRH